MEGGGILRSYSRRSMAVRCHLAASRLGTPPHAMTRRRSPRGENRRIMSAIFPLEIIGSIFFSSCCSSFRSRAAAIFSCRWPSTLLRMLTDRSNSGSKVGPGEGLDRPPVSTALTAAVDSLLPHAEQAVVSLRQRLSWPACGHQAARSRGWTGGRPWIGGKEAEPVCLCMFLSDAWARRGPERSPMD